MDGSITDEQVHIWLQEIAQGTKIVKDGKTTYSGSWVSLHFDNPSLGGEDRAELSGGGYKRFKMIWTQPTNRAIWSTVDARFTGLVANKVTYFGIWEQPNQGIMRAYAELPEPRIVLNGKGMVLHERMLVISFG